MKTLTNYTHPALKSEIANQPALYCGTYAKYNNGSIFGKWIDLTLVDSKEELYEICAEIHADEKDPEFMFQDFQSIDDSLIEESWISDDFFTLKDKFKELTNTQSEALKDFISYYGKSDLDDTIAAFEDQYVGQYSSEEDYARELLDECYDLDKMMGNLSYYFDYEKYARDLFISDYYMSDNGHVFRTC